MELSREHFRAIIFYNFRRGLSQQQCIDELNSTFGDEAPSKTTIYRWYTEFNRGRSSLSDEFREGRPKSVVVPENIDAVREVILQDRHVTYREIEASLGISGTSIHSILHEHLAVKKSDESWIYAYEPESKQQSTVWVFQDEPNLTKIVRARSTSKQMVACFFGKAGHVATVPLVQCQTANSEWYTTICLSEVFGKIRETNRRRCIILHQDNASSHISAQTRDFLRTEKVELIGHPPYSPDLAPNDFFLFPQIKNKLRGQRFSTPEEAVDAFKMHVLEVPQSEWKKCFENWFKRMQKCIDLHGEYFEKQ
ncbi:histone-lysine N-methyltransferase SETMAR-like [Harpegnathos saltator]|uniref:histone-lysine N-methyltransferase SETMAR-like n=1 Tax=Harpegnathos saltator TaxID=610380 RepID=UPI000DBED143|nr:histone-lysine N-methyltransferase SETMAR-like [Harpegnathos saltator]